MATRIKQGDAYAIPVRLRLDGELIDAQEVEAVEFCLGGGLRKLYPGEVRYEPEDNSFRLPLSQEETFAFPANGSVALDVRVKFAGGDVVGVLRPEALAVYDAESEVVL